MHFGGVKFMKKIINYRHPPKCQEFYNVFEFDDLNLLILEMFPAMFLL
jgi:hypothetical protein